MSTYNEQIKCFFLKLSGFGHVWDNRGTFSRKKLIREVKNTLIAITSLGEERANLSAFRTFVRFVLV